MSETTEKSRNDELIEESKGSPLALDKPRTAAADSQKERWMRFAKRLLNVLLRPATFWETTLEDRRLTLAEILWPHTVVMVTLRAAAGFIGALLGGATLGQSFASFGSSVVSWFALVLLFAFVSGFLVSARGGHIGDARSMRFAAYGLAPLFVVGMLAAVPTPYVAPVAEIIAMPYTFWVMGLGLVPLFGVKPERAVPLVGLLCGLLLIFWGVMPGLVPIVLHQLTR